MGALSALPALDVKPVQQPDILEKYGQLQQLRGLAQQQQIREQQAPVQQQILEQQAQTGQQDLAARQALNAAYAGAITKGPDGTPTFDSDKLMQNLSTGPAAYKSPEVLEGITKFQKSRLDLQTTAADLQTKQNDMIGAAAAAVKAAGYDPTLAHSLLDTLPQSPQLQQLRQQIDNPATLKPLIDSAIQNSAKQRELGASEQTAAARQTTAQTEQQKLQAQMNPQSTLYAPTPAAVALGTAPGAAQIQAGEAKLAGAKSAAEASARQPYEMSLAAQRQALSQGDPKAAGQLLVNGDATLSELKARGATPDFIAKTLFAAKQLSGGKYNAQSADAQFKVAQSPASLAFFGSAKSLTDKGGTLDQLAEAAKDIPANQIPVFNTIEDAAKAATGNGPIAKYASILVGVADDYSKVMGGGTGSDASRAQGFKLAAASASPAQRAGSIQGIRGAVGSQIKSRIGNNPVMQRMYGDETGGAPSGSGIAVGSVITQNGHQYKVTAVDKNGKPSAADPVN